MLFDYLVTGQVIPINPAHPVRGPRHSTARGKTPVLDTEQARAFFASIETDSIAGLRDRALIGVMVYSFARIGAVTRMRVKDYFPDGKRWWLRLHEKGGKHHKVPVHHKAEEYLDAYLEAGERAGDPDTPLFRTIDRSTKRLSANALTRNDALRMVKRRAAAAGLPAAAVCCHTWRATGITAYLENGGQLEHAAEIAAHASIRTTKLYDRRSDLANLDEIERIAI
jgi:integrase